MTALIIVLAGVGLAAAVIILQQRTMTAVMPMKQAVDSDFIKDSVRIDPESLKTLNGNCITRDYTIKLLSRVVELQELVGANPARISRGRELVGGISRCMNRTVSLDRIHLGKWILASRTIDVTDPKMYDALMDATDIWGVEDEPLDGVVKKRLTPLKDGLPTRAKLTTLEYLHQQFPDQKNIIFNMFRFYIALREYDSFRRLVEEPEVRALLAREKHNMLLSPYFEFEALARAEASPRARYMRAAFYFLHGDVDNAEAECATAMEIYPQQAAFHFLRALALHGQERQALAREAIARAIQLDPGNGVYTSARDIINDAFSRPRLTHPLVLCYHRVISDYSLETATVTPQQLESHLKFVNTQNLADARAHHEPHTPQGRGRRRPGPGSRCCQMASGATP